MLLRVCQDDVLGGHIPDTRPDLRLSVDDQLAAAALAFRWKYESGMDRLLEKGGR